MFGRKRSPTRIDQAAPLQPSSQAISGAATMTITGTGAVTDGWTPLDLSGLTVWVRGDSGLDAGGFTWTNDGTSGNFTEATNKPGTSTINSKVVVDFDATNDTCTDGTFANTTGNTWFAAGVFQFDTDRTVALVKDGTACPIIGSSAGGGGVYGYYNGTVMKLFAHQFNNAQGDKVTPTTDAQTTISTAAAHYFEASLVGATMSCRLDGNTDQPVTVTAAQQNTNGNTEIGYHAARSLTPFDGKVAEVIYTTATPSAGQLTAIRAWLASRWAVTTP